MKFICTFVPFYILFSHFFIYSFCGFDATFCGLKAQWVKKDFISKKHNFRFKKKHLGIESYKNISRKFVKSSKRFI